MVDVHDSPQKEDSKQYDREGHKCIECLTENACKEVWWKGLRKSALLWEQLLVISDVFELNAGNDSQETGSAFYVETSFSQKCVTDSSAS